MLNGGYKSQLKSGKSYLPSCAAEGIFKPTPLSSIKPTYAATKAAPEYHAPASTTAVSTYTAPSTNGSTYYVSGAESSAASTALALFASVVMVGGAMVL